ncbi:serine/threonine-protein phosphatase 7-like isoform X1 [Panicum virgatum]|uniref:serine/threonine-protein phosphatase 7-like isoform X1 n=1 Tax=Panicum virgatum TaxID=38727 RepID=UPI0019D5A55F|nr:serine/threonine-protein phosphatase 7-like isoform X1 [Panicum virgatum]XP_039810149.1 serine/threonine-protein phosphatase 7-like isoform X1 [Panicum virgatum]XP_039810150.1 serine/threonine-protein phosphatase 7-like isoform X1 [Panicum virgatum]
MSVDPIPKDPFTSWGLPDLESCQPYGRYCTGALIFPNSPHNAGMGSPRDELNAILDEFVNWLPYERCISLLPAVVQTDSEIWTAKIPLIHFWIVAMHYPDRVMRQFGLFQHIPPPEPLSWDVHLSLHRVTRLSAEGTNWAEKWEEYIRPWERPRDRLVNEVRPYDITTRPTYLKWFGQFGMRNVFSEHYHVRLVDEPQPLPSDPVNSITYVQHGDKWARQSFRAFKDAVLGINLVIRGMISDGKILLKSCRGHLIDLGEGDKFDRLLQEAGLPFDIDSISTDREPLSGIQTIQFTEEEYHALYNSQITLMDLIRRKETGQLSSSGSEFLGNKFTRDFPENEINVINCRLDPAGLCHNDSRNGPICPLDPPATESLSADQTLLSSEVEQACQTVPALECSPNKPVCWPKDDILTREWVADFSNMLDWSSRNLPPQQLPDVLPFSVVQKLVLTASNLLHREPNCIQVDPRADQTVTIVGDIHGQLHDAIFLLQAAGFPSESRIFVFNGDYVDRGSWGLETFLLLLAWKVFLPSSVFLLRGNHESKYCTSVYGFKNELFTKYVDDGIQIYQLVLKCFQDLPLASVVAGCVYTAHGGLFRGTMDMPQKKRKRARKCTANSSTVSSTLKLGSLEDLSKARRNVLDPPWKGSNLIPGDILWSDPSVEMGLSLNKARGGLGLLWGPDMTEKFMMENKLKLIVRSHEGPDARDQHIDFSGMNNGFTIDHQVNSGKLITVFSAPDYPQFQSSEERYNNLGAYIVLRAPDFATPIFCCFESVKPRPEAAAYYDYKEVMDSDEELDYSAMDQD